jgi:hypothetical protein
VDVPLRDILTKGCRPVDACHHSGNPRRDTSHAGEAVVSRHNEDDARVAGLDEFGYSPDLSTTGPPSRYAYSGSWQYRDPTLAYHHEKVSGTKAEMVKRIAGVCVKLYEKHKRKLRKLFKGRYVRLSCTTTDPARCFDAKLEPCSASGDDITDTPLKATVISICIMKHLRADRILDAAYKNTAYSTDDLARALLSRHVMLNGCFVRV